MGLFKRKFTEFEYIQRCGVQESKLKKEFARHVEQVNWLGWLFISEGDFKIRVEDQRLRQHQAEEEARRTGDFQPALNLNWYTCLMREIGSLRYKLKEAGWQPPSSTAPGVCLSSLNAKPLDKA
jgi:hypothetical protein